MSKPHQFRRINWFYIALGVVILLGVGASLFPSSIQVSQDWITLQQDVDASAKEKFDASLEILKAIVGGIGTIATIVAGIVLYLNFRVANRHAEIAESRLITERFSKAVEQLGNDKLEVRLGGIYALERIANDSDADYWVIMEVLTSFIREKSPQELIPERFLNLIGKPAQELPEVNELPIIAKDAQAALTVIGRRDTKKDPENKFIELNETNLSIRTRLVGANFKNARLWEAHIIQSDLRKADLSGADLEASALCMSDLRMANLSAAYLVQADLRQANLSEANLVEADLQKANLRGVIGLNPKQVKQAKNWKQAFYDDDFRRQLGLPLESSLLEPKEK